MSVNLNELQRSNIFSISAKSNKLNTRNFSFLPALSFLFSLQLSLTANALPYITDVQLSKSSAEFTTLTGTGFGSFNGKVLSWDSFDTKSEAQLHQAEALDGYQWSIGGDNPPIVDKQFALSGSQAIKLDWSQGKTSFFGWKTNEAHRRLYISYWRLMEGTLASGQHQQLQLFGRVTSKPPLLKLHIDNTDCWSISTDFGQPRQIPVELNPKENCWSQTTGKFQRWEMWVDLQQGLINAMLDNFTILNMNLSPASGGFTEVGLGYNSAEIEDGRTWIDDVYIANTLARVEACNAAAYVNCTRRYLQYVAADSWNNHTIRLRLHNLRALRGEPIYLYVIDAQGSVSNGIAIARPVIKAN